MFSIQSHSSPLLAFLASGGFTSNFCVFFNIPETLWSLVGCVEYLPHQDSGVLVHLSQTLHILSIQFELRGFQVLFDSLWIGAFGDSYHSTVDGEGQAHLGVTEYKRNYWNKMKSCSEINRGPIVLP